MTRHKKAILRLNLNSFDKEWMLQYAYTHLRDNWSPAPWKKDLMYFLIDWYSQKETVTATTSGSTGTPKTIELQKKFMEVSARLSIDFFGLQPGSKVLLALPAKYIAAKMLVVRSIAGRFDLYCIEPSGYPFSKFTPPELDFASFTPAQLDALLQTEEGRAFAGGIHNILLGGGPIPQSLEEKIKELQTDVWHSYGMTETMSHIALRKVNGKNATRAFYPLKGVTLEESAGGCLKITAPALGIYGLETNDMVTFDNKGGFTVRGRKDNVINSGGIKLFPEILEQKIEPLIKTPFYVTAKPHERYGEVPVLVIESEPWPEKRTGDLKKAMEGILNRNEIPKETYFIPAFKRTASGKVIRVKPWG